MSRRDFHKVIIGRSESLSFVGHDIVGVPAKTDTGAYRSAVHASDIKLNPKTGLLSFVLLGNHPVCGNMSTKTEVKSFKKVSIENSFGHSEERYEVKLKVKLGPKVFMARFTLADRSKKIYPILLGRKLLNDRFLVDSAESAINRVMLRERYSVAFPDDEEERRE
ncbi:MAG: RimK/LysX family protein [Candidatus Woesebacteria bacterium]|jgi:hypothetical protein